MKPKPILFFLCFVLLIGTASATVYSDGKIWVYGDTENLTSVNDTLQNPSLLENLGSNQWLLKVPLNINGSNTNFYINDTDCNYLKLLSNNTTIEMLNNSAGTLYIDDNSEISSWDSNLGAVSTNTTARAYINIIGKSYIANSTIHHLGNTTNPALQYFNTINISNSTIYSIEGKSWSGGIYVTQSSSNGIIEDNNFTDIGGIFLNTPNNYQINNNNVTDSWLVIMKAGTNNEVKNNTVNATGADGGIKQYYGGTDGLIRNNSVCGATKYGIYLYSDGGLISDFIIEQNTLFENGFDGLNVYGANNGICNLTIDDNTIYDNPADGIFLHGAGGDIWNFTITDSRINNNISNSVDGIAISGYESAGSGSVYNGTVDNNSISKNSHRNIMVEKNCSNISFSNNDLSDSLDSNFKFEINIAECTINNTNLSDAIYGIRLQHNCTDNLLEDINISDTTSTAMVFYYNSNNNTLKTNTIDNTGHIAFGSNSIDNIIEFLIVRNNTDQYHILVGPNAAVNMTFSNNYLARTNPNRSLPVDVNNYTINVSNTEQLEVTLEYFLLVPSSDSVDVNISDWSKSSSDNYYKKWNESCANTSVTSEHIIGDFPASTTISVSKNGTLWNTYQSNSSGWINFTYSDGYSGIKTFTATINDSIITPQEQNIFSDISNIIHEIIKILPSIYTFIIGVIPIIITLAIIGLITTIFSCILIVIKGGV